MEPAQKRLKVVDLVSSKEDENVPLIRKVNFSFEHNGDSSVDQQTTMLVVNHILQAGRIASLEVESHSTKTYGCVQFYKSGPGDHLLNNQEMECGGVQVRLWKAKDQPTDELNIVDLNDHCLQKIFFYLNSSHLKRITEVNKRFRHNAHAVFAIQNKSIKFSLLQKFATKEYMQNFGHVIKQLEIGTKRRSHSSISLRKPTNIEKSTLQLITSYCSLTALTLEDLNSISLKNITELFPPVFSGLTTLRVLRCVLSQTFIDVVKGCSELTTFEIQNCEGDWELPAFNIPKLRFFHFLEERNNVRTVSAMLRNNMQLNKVVINHSDLDNQIMNTIANNLPMVESISIGKFNGLRQLRLEPGILNALQNLKQIRLGTVFWRICDYPSSIMEKLADVNISLEYLEIFSENVPANNFLNKFPTLKKLYVVGAPTSVPTVSLDALDNLRDLRELVIGKSFAFNDSGLLKLISNNENLHKINFGYNDFEINSELYEKLAHIVQHRPQQIPIKVLLTEKSYKQINYPQTHKALLFFRGGGIFDFMHNLHSW